MNLSLEAIGELAWRAVNQETMLTAKKAKEDGLLAEIGRI